jgi:hypothetical protein
MIKKFKIFEIDHSDIDPYGEENWEELDLMDRFIKFLKDNDAYYDYIKNVNIQRRQKIENGEDLKAFLLGIPWSHHNMYIDYPITWSDTPEGHGYWSRLNTAWLLVSR